MSSVMSMFGGSSGGGAPANPTAGESVRDAAGTNRSAGKFSDSPRFPRNDATIDDACAAIGHARRSASAIGSDQHE